MNNSISYIVAVSLIGGGITDLPQVTVTNFITRDDWPKSETELRNKIKQVVTCDVHLSQSPPSSQN
jgi:hypothetical protein